ncbi:hypothetical protein NC653_018609 [Populus alba x Populus x berolinensis]|uniref:Uncharacterized protein n=1 Tax=Populus alba x Populus x berolinensis TaxID=444605 RepID=A0AAD6QGV7_9ROSI|nr:hypothetical protein NC653_018609 [Populus alba x Populus x berolinensis]
MVFEADHVFDLKTYVIHNFLIAVTRNK